MLRIERHHHLLLVVLRHGRQHSIGQDGGRGPEPLVAQEARPPRSELVKVGDRALYDALVDREPVELLAELAGVRLLKRLGEVVLLELIIAAAAEEAHHHLHAVLIDRAEELERGLGARLLLEEQEELCEEQPESLRLVARRIG